MSIFCSFLTFSVAVSAVQLLFMYRTASGEETNVVCLKGTFPCGGNYTLCVEQPKWCDGKKDCPNGEDEAFEHCADNHGSVDVLGSLHDNIQIVPTTPPKTKCVGVDVASECRCYVQYRQMKIQCKSINITNIPTPIPSNVSKLNIQQTSIEVIPSRAFMKLSKLKFLYLQNNMISKIFQDSFDGLIKLRNLYLNGNKLTSIGVGWFKPLVSLKWLNLGSNEIVRIDEGAFLGLNNLPMLYLQKNKLPNINETTFAHLSTLHILWLQQNHIESVAEDAFQELLQLTDLQLAENKITSLSADLFQGNGKLRALNMSENQMRRLPTTMLHPLTNLKSLDLKGMQIQNIDDTMFNPLENLSVIYFSTFQYCRYVLHVRRCEPNGDGISSFNNLLDLQLLRTCVWIVAFITCIGNASVVLFRILFKDEHKVHSMFIKNLCIADFMMGVYLMILAIHDALYRDTYNQYSLSWMRSWRCQATGFLAMIASEVSIFILCFMSMERYITIAFPYRSKKLSIKGAAISLTAMWMCGAAIAAIPIVAKATFGNFYGSNGVCFPLHIHDPWMLGWQYSALVFVGINFLAMILICFCYAAMFISIQKTRKSANSTSNDLGFAYRFFFIVLTDALCWFPVITIKILAFANIRISDSFYAWIAIFVLPINSSINPILYSLTTITFRRKLHELKHKLSDGRRSVRPSRGERRLSFKETSIVTSNAFTTSTALGRESNYIPLTKTNHGGGEVKPSLTPISSFETNSINPEMESPLLNQQTNAVEV